MDTSQRSRTKRVSAAAVAQVLSAAGHTEWRPYARKHRAGFAIGPGGPGQVTVYHTNSLWAGPQAPAENDLAITAYARTLRAAGYRTGPVPYPAERGVLHHCLNVSRP